ncbi:MAG: hypothetical protein AVDCRST_MAG49-1056, partial [uncultured Thermomicrobiales bacterium]
DRRSGRRTAGAARALPGPVRGPPRRPDAVPRDAGDLADRPGPPAADVSGRLGDGGPVPGRRGRRVHRRPVRGLLPRADGRQPAHLHLGDGGDRVSGAGGRVLAPAAAAGPPDPRRPRREPDLQAAHPDPDPADRAPARRLLRRGLLAAGLGGGRVRPRARPGGRAAVRGRLAGRAAGVLGDADDGDQPDLLRADDLPHRADRAAVAVSRAGPRRRGRPAVSLDGRVPGRAPPRAAVGARDAGRVRGAGGLAGGARGGAAVGVAGRGPALLGGRRV